MYIVVMGFDYEAFLQSASRESDEKGMQTHAIFSHSQHPMFFNIFYSFESY